MHPGELVAGRFEIERLAGAGGMGEVYRARDRHTGSPVALKLLLIAAEAQADRFLREGALLAELAHPGIVRYVAHGRAPGSRPYLAMEWLEGHDLDAHLASGKLSLGEGLALGARVAEALGAAHARGVIHRDIKPSNIFLVDGRVDRVRVLDFGIAHRGQAAQRVTRTGMVLGTPAYMAPEQARAARDLDARVDIFALGGVLFECLTGRAPFVAEHFAALLAKVLFEEPQRASELNPAVPESVDALIVRMLAKDKGQRPRDGADAATQIAAVAARTTAVSPGPPRVAAAAITAGEQRLLAVLMTAPVGLAWLPSPTVDQAGARSTGTQLLDESSTADDGAEQLEALRAAVGARGGRLELLADGSLLTTLTGSAAASDLAANAARCALDLRAILPDTPMALVTGRGVLTDRLPVGEAIDRAAALLRGGAAAKAVLLDEVSAGLLGARFEIRRDGPWHELRGERDVEELAPTLLGRPSPCVGRDRELAMLGAVAEECFSEAVARAVIVVAPAGVGKSRLRYELAARLKQRDEPPALWIGRGDPMTSGSPFGLLAPMIRRAAGILEGEPPLARRHKLAARVARRVKAAEAARVTQFIGELTGVPFPEGQSVLLRSARQDPMLMGDQIRRAFEDLLRAESEHEPLALLLEDLHWADAPSVKLLDLTLRALSERPLLVMAFARPELGDLYPKLWAARGAQEIRLGELGRKAAETFVRRALEGARPRPSGDEGRAAAVDPATVTRIVERASGNAFYLEELIRAVSEGRGDALPGTVLAMAQSRLEGLDPEARRVLRAAGVLGDVFWLGGVAKILGAREDDPEISAQLAELVDREVLVSRGEGAFAGQPEYAFRQALVREAAYASLTDADRTLAHRLAAEWLHVAGEGEALVLAEHFERGGAEALAVPWFLRATEQALDANDLGAVVTRAARGIAAGAAGKTRGRLLSLAAEAHWWRGEYESTNRAGVEAIHLLPRGGAPWCATVGHLCEVSYRLGDHPRLAQLVEALLTITVSEETVRPLALTMARVAVPLLIGGLYAHAEALLRRIETVDYGATRFPAVAAVTETARAFWTTFRSLDFEGGLACFHAAASSFERAGDVRGASRAAVLAECVRVQLGDYPAAESFFRATIAAAEGAGIPYLTSLGRSYLGSVLCRRGALDEALAVGSLAVEACLARNDRLMGVPALCHLSYTRALAGDPLGAEQDAQQALELAAGSPRLFARAAGTLAHARIAAGNSGAALGPATEGKRALDALGGIGEGDALVELAYARALEAAGLRDEAHAAIHGARARLLATAARVRSAEVRKGFLGAVAENAAILATAEAWLGG